jgi:hypothetical protein
MAETEAQEPDLTEGMEEIYLEATELERQEAEAVVHIGVTVATAV